MPSVNPMERPPLFILGQQRSGTNMMLRILAQAPGVRAFNEDDPRAFEDFRLRDVETIRTLIRESVPDTCLFKAITDTLQWNHLSAAFRESRFVFMFRNPFDLVLSWLVEFPSGLSVVNHVLDYDFSGRNGDYFAVVPDTPMVDACLRKYHGRFDSATDYANKVALFWALFHGLLIDAGFFERSDVLVIDYDTFIGGPEPDLRRVESFCGVTLPAASNTVPAATGGHYFTANIDVSLANDCWRIYQRVLEIGR